MPPCICTASARPSRTPRWRRPGPARPTVGDGLGDRVVDDRARGLHRDVQIGHPVLERLEAADRPAELHAVLGVLDGQIQAALRRADLLGGQQDRRGVGEAGVGAERGGVLRGSTRRQPAGGVHGGDRMRR